ncbi:acetyl/propionyl/methylcrotonyl-CoA carboxylase subunit alpha [Acidisphaera rubrifaciens]|uniref:Carbamoyl phosphate synthase large subunit n=1 Tax=Acidisphaera rubrifaciens HS-AP3 TaxID=1231350 RepID=A0A0D6P7F0_9PROT|nr:biotin carboxylase N-terminal domain-containing protein [Acidisphaera rubrifaciens]GAN76799.1 carbamoyl phosphate synthase large subunit [Acidisphaera rubrifaciens HS-AP3]
MFPSVLIANRGEIACRIVRTCRRLGIRSIAVFSEADRDAPHVRAADDAVAIGPAEAARSYLDVDAIVAAARMTGAAAVHPGYGFLSERAALPLALVAAGIAWVGPSVAAIEAMGSKRAAKALARDVGVPCVPGYDGDDQSDRRLAEEAARISYPLLIKASAGGGGRGMRRVDAENGLAEAITAARAEATAAFGNGELLIERLITRPRHIEVQIAGDRHGNVVHLGDRECSIQRSYQKLIEEAPAPRLTSAQRATLHAAAVSLARAIGYDSLGTVEFVLDEDSGAPFFLEMNTRLQVEHTVTEAITGLDLVEWQLRIAAGEPLPLTQEAIGFRGHAIEARLNAEEPAEDYRPATGTVLRFDPPGDLRVDAGIAAGSVVGPWYDSLLAKLIAHGDDREQARMRLVAGLAALTVAGVATNQGFLRDVLGAGAFIDARLTTRFLADTFPDGWRPPVPDETRLAALAVWLAGHATASGPWGTLGAWRLVRPARIYATVDDEEIPVIGDAAAFEAGGWHVRAAVTGDSVLLDIADAPRHRYAWARQDETIWVMRDGGAWPHVVRHAGDAALTRAGGADNSRRIAAPMPGLITSVDVVAGAHVAAGAVCVTMEAMKVVLRLPAPADGIVAGVHVAAGDTIAGGTVLVELTPA